MTNWDVYVSGVNVGQLPDHTLQMIKRAVRRDTRVWSITAGLLVSRSYRFFRYLLVVPPIIFGWVLLMVFAFNPAAILEVIEISQTQPAEYRQVAQNFLMSVFLVTTIFTFVIFLCDPIKLNSPYRAELGRRIRGVLNVPSDGEVTLEVAETLQTEFSL